MPCRDFPENVPGQETNHRLNRRPFLPFEYSFNSSHLPAFQASATHSALGNLPNLKYDAAHKPLAEHLLGRERKDWLNRRPLWPIEYSLAF